MNQFLLLVAIVLIFLGNVAFAEEEKAESTEAVVTLGADHLDRSREAVSDKKAVDSEENEKVGSHHHKHNHGGEHQETCSEKECTESECKHHSKHDEEHKPGEHKVGRPCRMRRDLHSATPRKATWQGSRQATREGSAIQLRFLRRQSDRGRKQPRRSVPSLPLSLSSQRLLIAHINSEPQLMDITPLSC